MNLLDNPILLSILFYPRRGIPNSSRVPGAVDGTIPVGNNIALGYRLFPHRSTSPLILYFHGNGEIASDYDHEAPEYHRIGASLLVVDYRGYGWSSGTPLVSALFSDCEPIIEALPEILQKANLSPESVFVMGRSLGSIPAIHTASQYPEKFKGLVVESGLAHLLPWLGTVGLPKQLLTGTPDPIGNLSKMKNITLPLLVIHGENDTLLPVKHGQALYDASPAQKKQIFRVPHAGHNDLLMYAGQDYHNAIGRLITGADQG